MKKIGFFMIVLSLLAFNAFGAEQKFGYVDLNRALNESSQGKEAVNTLEETVKAKQILIDLKGSEIKKLEEEISKQSSVLTHESFQERKEEHEKLLRDYQRMVQDTQNDIQKRQSELMKKIILDLRKLIMKIGEEEAYSAIFETAESGLLYMPKEKDITDMVIKRFSETGESSETEK